jgi:tetrathionate reductase subunit B
VNYDDCIGCRYCMIACPYNARYFREEQGVVDKCTFCVQRVDKGKIPACVETCPSKVRLFGDLDDPDGALAQALMTRRYLTKKSETGNGPQLYYLL